jgi:hypothetical protein
VDVVFLLLSKTAATATASMVIANEVSARLSVVWGFGVGDGIVAGIEGVGVGEAEGSGAKAGEAAETANRNKATVETRMKAAFWFIYVC